MRTPKVSPKFPEFVALIASITALSALAIDNLLPAFTPIGVDFGVENANDLQLLVFSYTIAVGVMQIFYGPIADAIGRRPVAIFGILVYAAGCLLAVVASSLTMLLIARVIQGIGGASGRVVTMAIVRDQFSGREMARVMSFSMMVFITVPMLAPALGTLFLLMGSWRYIFFGMLFAAGAVGLWFFWRMPETLHPEHRRKLSLGQTLQGFGRVIRTRVSIGYGTASGCMFGCVLAYVGSAEQIFQSDVYALGHWFPLIFAGIAFGQGLAALVNSRLVRRLGMRFISHTGACMFVGMSAVQLLIAFVYGGEPPLILFCVTLAFTLFLFGLTVPNFNAMAMEPMGDIAGTASSFLGCYTMLMGVGFGLLIGQAFDGTVLPLTFGFFILSVLSFIFVLVAEKGKLFQPQQITEEGAAP